MASKEKRKAFTEAERQRRRQEKVKREGGYEEYEAKHARTVHAEIQDRKKQAEQLKSYTGEKKAQLIQERRKKIAYVSRKAAENRQTFHNKRQHLVVNRRTSVEVHEVEQSILPRKDYISSRTKRKEVVRQLSEELDDKDTPSNKKRLSAFSNETRDAVKSFYERDDVSRISPGKRDFIIIRGPNGEKEKAQKRHLYLIIKDAHCLFQDENPNVKIGSSKFAELRPQKCTHQFPNTFKRVYLYLPPKSVPCIGCHPRPHPQYSYLLNQFPSLLFT